MKTSELMTSNPCCCSADDSARDVAQMMQENDCGSVPVVDPDSQRVIGIVTDRDLALRGIAQGKGPDTKIAELMTPDVCCCGVSDDVSDVEQAMTDNQVRRVPIVDAGARLVGIIAQADLARAAAHSDRVSDKEVAIVVERISEPASVPIQRASRAEPERRI